MMPNLCMMKCRCNGFSTPTLQKGNLTEEYRGYVVIIGFEDVTAMGQLAFPSSLERYMRKI